MALANANPGHPITISIGKRGQRPDLIAARVAGQPVIAYRNGRPELLAPVITVQKSLAGETYLGERMHNLQFAFDRTERVELLDGTSEAPKSLADLIKEKSASTLAFFATRPVGVSAVMDMDSLLDSVE